MPSQRRMRAFGLLLLLTIVIVFYMSRSGGDTRNSDFYTKTQEALQVKEFELAAKQRDADDVGARLKAAEEAAKKSADEKSQKYMDAVAGEKSVAGRVYMNQQGDERKVPGVANVGGRPRDRENVQTEKETEEEHEVEVELNAILKKSPMIIFSKTYCPHSKKAKHILLDKNKIVPEPYVVELDEHPLGPQLQAWLANSTGRKTVPNVLLMGMSLGGGDDIESLENSNTLLDTVKSIGGGRIIEASPRPMQITEMRKLRL